MAWQGLAAAIAAGIALGLPLRGHDGLARYDGDPIAFSYPREWRYAWGPSAMPELHYSVFLSLSTQPLRDPCTSTVDANGLRTTTCASPLAAPLARGGVLVQWDYRYCGAPCPHARANTRIGGRPARINVSRRGGVERITALLDVADLRMQAVLRAPRLRLHERQVRAMLRSLRFTR